MNCQFVFFLKTKEEQDAFHFITPAIENAGLTWEMDDVPDTKWVRVFINNKDFYRANRNKGD